jgi:arylsulfatase A-like enzyme
MFSTRPRQLLGAAAGLAVAIAVLAVVVGADPEVGAAKPERPNIIVILSDDQQNSTLNAMPYTKSRDDWVKFNSAMVNTALCCPSRSTLLTGLTSDHTGIVSNSETALFNGQSTIADWLDESGYQTGFVGKYLNEFPWEEAADFVPSGWDYWASYSGNQGYYDYTLNDNGTLVEEHGLESYSTDVFTEKMVEYITSADSEQPFFGLVSFFGPHSPWSPAPRDREAKVKKLRETEAFFEKNVKDKPSWVQGLPIPDLAEVREDRVRHQRAMLAVDDGVRAIFKALRQKGELKNTVVVYTSDHGIGLGDHRYTKKTCGYEICSRVPLLIRAPGVEGRTESALVGNIDFTPTFADYAGIKTGKPVDGRSLKSVIDGRRAVRHKDGIYLRRGQGNRDRVFAGLRTEKWKLLNYGKVEERELYNLSRDPNEVRNLLATKRSKWERKADQLYEQLQTLRRKKPKVR